MERFPNRGDELVCQDSIQSRLICGADFIITKTETGDGRAILDLRKGVCLGNHILKAGEFLEARHGTRRGEEIYSCSQGNPTPQPDKFASVCW